MSTRKKRSSTPKSQKNTSKSYPEFKPNITANSSYLNHFEGRPLFIKDREPQLPLNRNMSSRSFQPSNRYKNKDSNDFVHHSPESLIREHENLVSRASFSTQMDPNRSTQIHPSERSSGYVSDGFRWSNHSNHDFNRDSTKYATREAAKIHVPVVSSDSKDDDLLVMTSGKYFVYDIRMP